MRKAILRATNIPVAIALVVIIVAGSFAEYQRREMHRQDVQAEVLNKVGLVRARLEGAINGNLQLARGLVAAIASEPDMPPERFTDLVEHLLDHGPQIINIAAAPDLVVTMLHPLEGNEQALGLDYAASDDQRDAALRARDSRELVLAGPIDLVQGGQGFIGRFPVFVPEGDGEQFWGVVSVVIDVERLYRDAGLLDPDLGIDIAISGRDALGAEGAHFFGQASIFSNDPVRANIMLPSGSWTIAAVPAGGWESRPPDLLRLRLWILLAAALILVPTVITGRLMDERQRNVAQAVRRERELETLSRRLKLALETSKVGVWEQDFGQDEEHWDARFNAIFGYPEDGGRRFYRHWSDRLHPDDLEKAIEDYDRAVSKRGTYESQYRIVLPDGEVRHVRAFGVIYSDTGASDRVVGVIFDVTEDVRMTEELRQANAMMEARNAELETARRRIEHNALHDSLTGLPNRRYLDQVLAEHAIRFDAGKEWAALLHVDLDRFKQINDTMGHAAGDAVLAHAAAVLSSAVTEGDFVARVGGDEFVILCRRPKPGGDLDDDRLALLAQDLIKRMREPILFEGHECRCGISIGIAADSDAVAEPRQLLINADIALYRAKRQGRNRFQFFNDALRGEIVRTKRVADDILVGIEAGQFVPWFQPQVDARTLEIVGVEALARWNHPRDGVLPPAAFMKIAEELNVVGRIDRTIMEQTLRHMAEWDEAGLYVPKASVNVSARRLNDEALIDGLSQARFEPGRLAFELVESIFLDENDDMIAWNVERIKDLGIDIEIDDFGTGYASIVSLLKLKPSRLKIDRQFIMPILRSPAQRQLVGSIVEIGKSLGIEVLAEGVETMDHARMLRQLGCQALQGYAFARPMPADAFADFARDKGLKKAS